jgi:hypothetical protein
VLKAVSGQFTVTTEVRLLQLKRKLVPMPVTVAGIASGLLNAMQPFMKLSPMVVTFGIVSSLLNNEQFSMKLDFIDVTPSRVSGLLNDVQFCMNAYCPSLWSLMLVTLSGMTKGWLNAVQFFRKLNSMEVRFADSVRVLLKLEQPQRKLSPMLVRLSGSVRG